MSNAVKKSVKYKRKVVSTEEISVPASMEDYDRNLASRLASSINRIGLLSPPIVRKKVMDTNWLRALFVSAPLD